MAINQNVKRAAQKFIAPGCCPPTRRGLFDPHHMITAHACLLPVNPGPTHEHSTDQFTPWLGEL